MWSIVFNILKMIVTMLKYPFYALLIVIAIYTFLISVNVVIGLFQGKRFKKGNHVLVKQEGFLKKLLVLFPKRFTDDLF